MSDNMVVRPEDVVPDGVETGTWSGVEVRKGTIAAFLENARRLGGLEPGTAEYEQLRATVPALTAVGIFEFFEVRSPDLRRVLAGE